MKKGIFVGVQWIKWEDVNKAEEIWKKRGIWCESRQMKGESYYELLFNYEDFPHGKNQFEHFEQVVAIDEIEKMHNL